MNRFETMCAIGLVSIVSGSASAELRGVVMTREGVPLAGAKVSVYPVETATRSRLRLQSAEPQRKAVANVETSARGQFSVAFDLSVADLQIEAEGHAPYATRVLKDEEIGTCVLRSAARKSGVVSADGKPVSGARVVWSGPAGAELVTVTTDDGRYSIPDPETWAMRVHVVHDAYAIDEESSKRAAPRPALDRRLKRGVAVRGEVVAVDGSAPAAEAEILVDGWKLGVSGDDGTFAVEHAPAKWKQLQAVSGETSAIATNGSVPVRLRLARTPRIMGVVHDSEGRGVVAGAEIAAFSHEGGVGGVSRGGTPSGTAISDAKGVFAIELPAGNYELGTAIPGYELATIEASVPPGGTTERSIPLARLARVTGRVVDDGNRPVVAAVVVPATSRGPITIGPPGVVMSRAGISGPDGSFVLRAAEPGDDVVLEAGAFGTSSGIARPVQLRRGETKSGVVITIPRGIEVAGFVSDPSGAPLSKARISPRNLGRSSMRYYFANLLLGDGALEDAFTKDDGRFMLRLPPGEYGLWFSLEGYVAYMAPTMRVEPGLAPLEVTLHPGMAVRGRVVREGKGGIAGANVELPEVRDAAKRSAVTGPDGAFAIESVPRGMQRLTVTKQDELISITRIVEVPAADYTIEIPRGESVEGRVIDKESRAPITEFSVGIATDAGGGAMRWLSAPMLKSIRDDEGRFRLEGIATGPVNVVAAAPGFVRKRAAGLTLEDGKPIRDLEIALERGTTIKGRVTDPDGKPVSEVRITSERDTSGVAAVSALIRGETAATDASGSYRMDAVEPGERTFRFDKRGFPPVIRPVKLSGREMSLDVQFSRGATIEGIVITESGAPVEAARITVRGGEPFWADGRTNADGRFRIEGVGGQRCDVGASRNGYVNAELEGVDPSTAKDLRLVLKQGGRLRGRVIGLEPWEYSKTRVSAHSDEGSASASLDSAGNFEIEAAPTGTVLVLAWKVDETSSLRTESERRSIELQVGGDASVELEFRKGRKISGHVTRNGAPLSGASLRWTPLVQSVQTRGAAMTDGSGKFEVEGLDDGEYRVSVQPIATIGATHYLTRTIGPATTSIDIDLEVVQVRGRVSLAGSGGPLEGARIVLERTKSTTGGLFAQRMGESDFKGDYVIDDVDPGTWVARAEMKGFATHIREIEVGNMGATGIDFEIAEGEGFRLRIVDARTGVAVEGRFRAVDSLGRKAHEGASLAGGDGARVSLPAGTYRLDAWSDGYAPVSQAISVPSADLTIALIAGGSLEIELGGREPASARLVDATGADVRLTYWSTQSSIRLSPGSTMLQNIPPGSYTLIVGDASGIAKSFPLTIREGTSTKVKVGN